MSSIEAILYKETLFEIILEIKEKFDLHVVFRRFKKNGYQPGYFVIDSNNLSDIYNSEGFELIYLAQNVPEAEEDYNFLSREADLLLEIKGGRHHRDELELSQIRLMSKKPKNKLWINVFRKQIKILCNQGIRWDDSEYPKIFWDKKIDWSNTKCWNNIDDKDWLASPI